MSGELVSAMNGCEVKYMNNTFVINSFDCDSQYNQFYKSRSRIMRHMIEKSIANKWTNDNINIVRVRDIADNCHQTNNKMVIIGTVIKHMRLQPSILKEMSEQNQLIPQPILNRYTSDDDMLWLQDGDEIIEICGNIDASIHVTGVCVALMGTTDDAISRFNVEDVCYATADDGIQLSSTHINTIQNDQYVAIISGLGFSKNMDANTELSNALIMFMNYIRGDICSNYTAKQVSHVIIAGNSIGINARKQESECELENNTTQWNRRVVAQTINATKLFDKFVYSLAQLVSVDVMPGDLDPTTQLLPQQPLHPCIFKKSKQILSMKCVTNPHCAQYNGRVFLGTSGQNIKSLLQYSKLSDEMEAMRKTLEWCHLAPTCPDTLFSYPYVDTDPFVINQYPDVYFAGNQREYNSGCFEASNGKKVVMISVPVFETKLSCVLVNLNSLKCEMLFLA